jgi:hypothetical protein
MQKDPNEGARLLRVEMEARLLTQVVVDKMLADALAPLRSGRRRAWGGSVSRYLSGERKPERQIAVALRDLFPGKPIPVESWDQKPQSKRAPRHADGVSRGPVAASTRKIDEATR